MLPSYEMNKMSLRLRVKSNLAEMSVQTGLTGLPWVRAALSKTSSSHLFCLSSPAEQPSYFTSFFSLHLSEHCLLESHELVMS